MDKFKFIVSKETQGFVSILPHTANELTTIGLNLDLYSVLISDEPTARGNFTLTGHLPSETFESMLNSAKGIEPLIDEEPPI